MRTTARAESEALGQFDLDVFVDQRDNTPNFVMVEIGHGMRPAAYNQEAFIGQRAYIGLEAWLRDPLMIKRQHLKDLILENPGQNIFYLTHDLGGHIERKHEDQEGPSQYVGTYDPATVLPEAIAHEVYLSNVFGDPHVAHSDRSTERLLAEANRLLAPAGKIVVRETITPHYVRLDRHTLDGAGLWEDAVFTACDEGWSRLEEIYEGTKRPSVTNGPSSFFKVISKASEPGTHLKEVV